MPFYIMGLCHEELYQLYCIKTGQPVVWRERGKNLYEQQLKEKQRLRELDEKMKLQGRTLNEQLDKPLNAELWTIFYKTVLTFLLIIFMYLFENQTSLSYL